jgi:cytochrome c-type biogenesis protein
MITTSTYLLSYIAGILSLLSPCVLPIVPILLATAISTHRLGPYALAGGLSLSFTTLGIIFASVGTVAGFDPEQIRKITAILLIVFGVILVFPMLQEKFAIATSALSNSGQTALSNISTESLFGQMIIGLLLGIVWSPCVGPTLGAAIALASQGHNLFQIAMVMLIFGLGAATPLVILGSFSHQKIISIRNKLFNAGNLGKKIFGVLLILSGSLIVSGIDKSLESTLLNIAPDWWVKFSTSI